jgi:peptidoglycan hydrolase CwlO-like protein
MKNLNIKDYLIIVLFLGVMIFGYISLFRGDKLYEYKLEELKKENLILLKMKDSLGLKINGLESQFITLKAKETELINDINNRDLEIARSKEKASKSKAELDKFKREMQETRNKIDSLKAHPANRTGDDLLNSIKLKTQK